MKKKDPPPVTERTVEEQLQLIREALPPKSLVLSVPVVVADQINEVEARQSAARRAAQEAAKELERLYETILAYDGKKADYTAVGMDVADKNAPKVMFVHVKELQKFRANLQRVS